MSEAAPANQTHSVTLAMRNETNGETAFLAYTFATKAEADRFSEWASARGYNPRPGLYFTSGPGRYFTSVQEAIRHTATSSSSYWI